MRQPRQRQHSTKGDPTSIDTRVGEKVRTSRIRNGLVIAEVAQELGISGNQLSLLERGIHPWKLVYLQRLAGLLGFSLVDLFE